MPMQMELQEMQPPGTWCTDWAFLRAVDESGARNFLEVGCGEGRVAGELVDLGLWGYGIDPSAEAVRRCRLRLAVPLASRRFRLFHGTLQEFEPEHPVDLVYSQMVLEHVADDLALVRDMIRCVRPDGTVIAVVPARPERWGPEDDLSGHLRRYDRESLTLLFRAAGLKDIEIKSLNVPVSNVLRRLSEQAVGEGLAERSDLDTAHRTELSGLRDVPYKNRFPAWCRLVLNRTVMWPFCQLQRAFFGSDRGLVLMATGRVTAAVAHWQESA